MSQLNGTATYLSIDDRLAYVESWGEGDPILCIHTAGQSGVQYRHCLEGLVELGYRVVVPDMPGHGRSEPHRDGPVTDLSIYAKWLVDITQRLELQQPVILGCSIGGKLALDVASRMGIQIRSVISMAANADHGHVNVRSLQRELQDIAAPSRSDRTYFGTRAVVGSEIPEQRRELIARMHCREDPQVSISDLLAWGGHDIREALGSIEVPTLVIAGTDDLWISLESVRRTAELIPDATYLQLEGIGHYPMEEMADFAQSADRWITELDQRAAGTAQGRSPAGAQHSTAHEGAPR